MKNAKERDGMKDIVMNLEKTIRRDEQGGYPEIRFDMPDRTGRVEVSCEYEPAGENCVIDLGIRDGRSGSGLERRSPEKLLPDPGGSDAGISGGTLAAGRMGRAARRPSRAR